MPIGHGLEAIDLGRMPYQEAYQNQVRWHERVLAARGEPGRSPAASPGVVLLVEHPPVITAPRRASAAHVLADAATLTGHGVELCQTDRGGDVTYHGPGQLVAYPIVDLQSLGLKLGGYMRLLEQVVIDTIGAWGVEGVRDPGATGVWVSRVDPTRAPADDDVAARAQLAKIAAMGVRIRRWATMHGLSLNVDPDMRHFQLIVPCGLAGRPVTSLRALLRGAAPSMDEVKGELVRALRERLNAQSSKLKAES
jgi:lipoyl(octanoyl) transferase